MRGLVFGAVLLVLVCIVVLLSPTVQPSLLERRAGLQSPSPQDVEGPFIDLTSRTSLADSHQLAAIERGDPSSGSGSPSSPSSLASGRVIDLSGKGVPGLPIRFDRVDSDCAFSGTDGSFTLPYQPGDGCLIASDAVYQTLLRACPQGGRDGTEYLIVVSPSVSLEGEVLDDAGTPVEGALLWQLLDVDGLAVTFPLLAETHLQQAWTRSDAEGRFQLTNIPTSALLQLQVSKPGYRTQVVTMPAASTQGLRFALERDRQSGLQGVVEHPNGLPAAGATVMFGAHYSSRCTETGSFFLELGNIEESENLVAVLKGHQPALLESFGKVVHANSVPSPLVLRLGPECMTIGGRVVQADGTPLPGWKVRLATGNRLSPFIKGLVEDLASRLPAEAITDHAGYFTLGGLFERTYQLEARDPRTHITILSDPILAGTTGAVLTVPEGALRQSLEVRVSFRDGTPVANASVDALVGRIHDGTLSTERVGVPVLTDELGHAELSWVPRDSLLVCVSGADLMDAHVFVPAENDGVQEISVLRRCSIRVDATSIRGEALATVGFLNEDGSEQLAYIAGGFSATRIELSAGMSPWLTVAESVTKVVVYSVDGEGHAFSVGQLDAELPRTIVLR